MDMRSSGSGICDWKESREDRCQHLMISDEVQRYLSTQPCDYRVCTSCGGPILLPVSVKRPKATDIRIPVGARTLYISRYQAPFFDLIDRDMIPWYMRHDH